MKMDEAKMRNRLMGRGEMRISAARSARRNGSGFALLPMCFFAAILVCAATSAGQTKPLPASDAASGLPMMPSGLPVVSTTSAGRDTIAIDAIGALFVSHDQGRNWKRVKQQWKGRAMKVRLVGAGSGFSPPGFGAKKSAHAGAALAVFELVNEKNAVWASADGVKWTAE